MLSLKLLFFFKSDSIYSIHYTVTPGPYPNWAKIQDLDLDLYIAVTVAFMKLSYRKRRTAQVGDVGLDEQWSNYSTRLESQVLKLIIYR